MAMWEVCFSGKSCKTSENIVQNVLPPSQSHPLGQIWVFSGMILALLAFCLTRLIYTVCKHLSNHKQSLFKLLINEFMNDTGNVSCQSDIICRPRSVHIFTICVFPGCSPSERLISRVGGQARSKTPNADMERSAYGADCTSTPTYLNKATPT